MKAHGEKIYFLAYFWAPVVALALICGLYYGALRDMQAGVQIYDAGNKALLQDFVQAKTQSDISVIALGNSRLRHALTVGFNPQEKTILPDGRSLAVLQFGLDGAGFFNFADMADDIIAAKPDYLVIMPNVLTNRRTAQPFFMDKAVTVTMYLNRLLSDQNPQAAWEYERRYIISECYTGFLKKRMDQHLQLLAFRDSHALDGNESYKQALSFLHRARDAGIKIILLDLEPNMAMLNALDVKPHQIDFPGLGHSPSCRALLPDLYKDIQWASYYPVEGARHFCDFMHLNAQGRAAFTHWFLTLLSKDWHSADLCPVPTSQ